MNKPRMWWNGSGWVLDTETGLTLGEERRAIAFTLKVQVDRLLCLPPGDKRDECERTIAALRCGRVTQNIIGVGDKVLFDAYKSAGNKVFPMGA